MDLAAPDGHVLLLSLTRKISPPLDQPREWWVSLDANVRQTSSVCLLEFGHFLAQCQEKDQVLLDAKDQTGVSASRVSGALFIACDAQETLASSVRSAMFLFCHP